jgi:hypothetical protein
MIGGQGAPGSGASGRVAPHAAAASSSMEEDGEGTFDPYSSLAEDALLIGEDGAQGLSAIGRAALRTGLDAAPRADASEVFVSRYAPPGRREAASSLAAIKAACDPGYMLRQYREARDNLPRDERWSRIVRGYGDEGAASAAARASMDEFNSRGALSSSLHQPRLTPDFPDSVRASELIDGIDEFMRQSAWHC